MRLSHPAREVNRRAPCMNTMRLSHPAREVNRRAACMNTMRLSHPAREVNRRAPCMVIITNEESSAVQTCFADLLNRCAGGSASGKQKGTKYGHQHDPSSGHDACGPNGWPQRMVTTRGT
eukprot:851817-Pelagomonas_calceolata.AAC.1